MRPEDARALALAEELGAQLGRLKGAGPKLTQFLSVLAFDDGPLGALPAGARAVPFGRVKKVLEQDLDERVGKLFDSFEEKPFALASLGQVHRARTLDGDDVAVKIQHPGVAEAVESDLRSFGIVGPSSNGSRPGSTGARCWRRSVSGSPASSTTRSRPSSSAGSPGGSAAIRMCGSRACIPGSRRAACS